MITAWEQAGPASAPPLVLLHSLGSDRTMWRPQVGALADTFRVVVLETRGHGQAPAPPGPYTIDDLGRDVLDTLDHLDIDTAHLCGLSLGGLTALWLAIHHPERFDSLTAANTAARIGTADGWQARIDAVRRHGLAGIRDDVLERFFAPGFADRHPDTLAEAQQAFTRADDDGYIACCTALADTDLTGQVDQIDLPTLLIGGTHDQATPPDQARWLHQHIPGSHLEILHDAAHIANLDQPAAFTHTLREHLLTGQDRVDSSH